MPVGLHNDLSYSVLLITCLTGYVCIVMIGKGIKNLKADLRLLFSFTLPFTSLQAQKITTVYARCM